jgi:hypothetical protein
MRCGTETKRLKTCSEHALASDVEELAIAGLQLLALGEPGVGGCGDSLGGCPHNIFVDWTVYFQYMVSIVHMRRR